jgi:hypothetical protein
MGFDISKVVAALGEEALGKAGEPAGLDKPQSVRVAKALAAHAGLGSAEMVKAAAADTGLDEEVVAAMSKRLLEIGAEKLMQDTPAGAAVDNMKDSAMAALSGAGGDAAKQAGGLLKGLFGKK